MSSPNCLLTLAAFRAFAINLFSPFSQTADILIVAASITGILFSYYQYTVIAKTTIKPQPTSESSSLRALDPKITENL